MERVPSAKKDDQGTDIREATAPFTIPPLNDFHVCRSWEGLSSLLPPTIATHYRVRAQNSAEDRFAFNGEYFELYDQADPDGKHRAKKSPSVTAGVWRCEFYRRRVSLGKPEGWTKVPIRAAKANVEIEVIVDLESDSPASSGSSASPPKKGRSRHKHRRTGTKEPNQAQTPSLEELGSSVLRSLGASLGLSSDSTEAELLAGLLALLWERLAPKDKEPLDDLTYNDALRAAGMIGEFLDGEKAEQASLARFKVQRAATKANKRQLRRLINLMTL